MGIETSCSNEHLAPWKLSLDRASGHFPPLLPGSSNVVSWHLTISGLFYVGSAYRALCQHQPFACTVHLWKSLQPLKIEIFVWHLPRDRLCSSMEVAKQHGACDGLCLLCNVFESRAHIFFSCPAAFLTWVAGPGPGRVPGCSGRLYR